MAFEINTRVYGWDEVIKGLTYLSVQINSDLTIEDLTIIGARVLELAQETVAVRTGALRDSLQVIVDAQGLKVTVGTDIGYGKYVELGTSKMQARPFLMPAVFQAISEFKQAYPSRLLERIRK